MQFRCCWQVMRLLFVGCLGQGLFVQAGQAADCIDWSARVVSVQGQVFAQHAPDTTWESVSRGSSLCVGASIRVGEQSRAALRLPNNTILRLDQHSSLSFADTQPPSRSILDLIKGAAHFISRDPRALTIHTPYANAAVEGTELVVRVREQQTRIVVIEGSVRAFNDAGELLLGDGDAAVVKSAEAPRRDLTSYSSDSVRWALYYPPVFLSDDKAIDPRLHQAAQWLYSGQVDQANDAIDAVLAVNPTEGVAYALQSVIRLVGNDAEQALVLAQVANRYSNADAVVTALSYAWQANHQLIKARDVLGDATDAGILVWLRRAELELSLGNIDAGVAAATQVVTLAPTLGRAHTLLGFSALLQLDLESAAVAFEQAMVLDQVDPLPHLGVGLLAIRQGVLVEGRQALETAMLLDPARSLLRSYLGRAYFAEGRAVKAQTQLDLALTFDPADPTPWLYAAMHAQTQNQPVVAMRALQESVERNDNRAVFRSRLQLDADRASRSAGLGQIYRDLGFEQLAVQAASSALETDPGNYSAHRLLADSYVGRPRHEIARVSELLQAQLRQPLRLQPLPPTMSESRLQILEGVGPADPTLTEFSPLFDGAGHSARIAAVVGEGGTFGEEMIAAALWDRVALSVGQFHYESDGYRDNNDQQRDLYNVFAQVQLSSRTQIQAEVRRNDFESGDLALDLGFGRPSLSERTDELTEVARIGLYHRIDAQTDLIASVMGSRRDETTISHDVDFPVTDDVMLDSRELRHSIELQATTKREGRRHLMGLGLIDETTSLDRDVQHSNAYLYSYIQSSPDMNWTLGMSVDAFDDGVSERHQVNPKVGLRWRLSQNETFRAAAFRTMKRNAVADQTLEPTQVAGFNQFYLDDQEAADSKNYAVGVDWRQGSSLSSGLEYLHRSIDVVDSFTFAEVPWEEQQGRAYAYWTPRDDISVALEYRLQQVERDESFSAGVPDLTSEEIPLRINKQWSNQWSSQITTRYVRQSGGFDSPGGLASREDAFWITDVLAEYRLPQRKGKLSIGAHNVFDEAFEFHDLDPENPRLRPQRFAYARLTVFMD